MLVVYATGRNRNLTEYAMRQFGIRYPHVLFGDVGTLIRNYAQDGWKPYGGWNTHVKRTSPWWDADAIHNAVAGLTEQERDHCGLFTQNYYYVDYDRNEAVLKTVEARVKYKFD